MAIQGCACLNNEKKSSRSDLKPNVLDSAKVLDLKRIQQGGRLAVLPFKAGENVEATAESDKMSLAIIKGFADILVDRSSRFELVSSANVRDVDFYIEGHITAIHHPAKLSTWLKNDKSLSVKGKMIDRMTGKVVFVFSDSQEATGERGNIRDLASTIGENVGRYLVSLSQNQ